MPRVTLPPRSPRAVPAARSPHDAVRAVTARRLRSIPYVAAGSVLTLGAVAVLAVTFVKVGGRVPVLVVDQPVQVGQAISLEDLKVVDIAPGTLSSVVSADDESKIVGQPAAVPLVAGEVLTKQLVGVAAFPPPGFEVATAKLRAGSYPPHLVAGSRVQVMEPASGSDATARTVGTSATVTEVSSPDDQGEVIVGLLADQESARAVGSAPAESLSLVLLPVGG